MFNKDFYPTKPETLKEMVLGHDLIDAVILEPHGGSGNIIDELRNNYGVKEIIACENDPKLSIITKSKADRFLKNNLFDVKSEEISHVDYIIANPPFSNCLDHILHMWKICPGGCTILTLCNYDTLKYNDTKKAVEVRNIIEDNGKYEKIHNSFIDAERKTSVGVAFITLLKEKSEDEHEFDGYFDMNEEKWGDQEGILQHNSIQSIVNRVISSVNLFNETLDSTKRINDFMGPIGSNLQFGAYQKKGYNELISIDRKTFKKELQKSAWLYIFSKMNMNKYVTRSVKETLNKFVEQQEKIPFTMKNISQMIDIITGTHKERMDGMLVEVFDKICSFAPGNSQAGETWKTNSNYKINKKFIHGYMCDHCRIMKYEYVNLSYGGGEWMDDAIKALCYLTGRDYDTITPLRDYVRGLGMPGPQTKWLEWGRWYDWSFFRIKGYKKGTMHFEFQDNKVWELFNRKVGEIKGWQLPKETDKRTKGTEHTHKATSLLLF